jgi:hypothetical protein
MPDATLYNPETGDRVVANDDTSQGFFDTGYYLETSYDSATGESTYDDSTAATPVDTGGGSIDDTSDTITDETTDTGDGEDITIEEPTDDINPVSEANQAYADEIDAQIDQLNQVDNSLAGWQNSIEDEYAPIIENLRNAFSLRKDQMKQLNAATLAGMTASGIRAGRQRYANEMQTSILSAEEGAGIQRLTQIDAEEGLVIAELKMAINDKAWDRFNDTADRLRSLHQDKIGALTNLRDANWAEEDRRRNKLIEGREDEKYQWDVEDRIYSEALKKFQSLVDGGIDINSLTDEEYTAMEEDLGMMEGSLEGLWVNMQEAKMAEAQGDWEERDIAITNVLIKIPLNQSVTIGGQVYQGMKPLAKTSGPSNGPGGDLSDFFIELNAEDIRDLRGAGWTPDIMADVVNLMNTPDPETGEYYKLSEVLDAVSVTRGTDITPIMREAMTEALNEDRPDQSLEDKFGYGDFEFESKDIPAQMKSFVTETAANMMNIVDLEDVKGKITGTDYRMDRAKLDSAVNSYATQHDLNDTQKRELTQMIIDHFERFTKPDAEERDKK